MKIKCKDFEIKSFRKGSRIANQQEYAYKIIYNNPTGIQIVFSEIFYTKKAANKYISQIVKAVNND